MTCETGVAHPLHVWPVLLSLLAFPAEGTEHQSGTCSYSVLWARDMLAEGAACRFASQSQSTFMFRQEMEHAPPVGKVQVPPIDKRTLPTET